MEADNDMEEHKNGNIKHTYDKEDQALIKRGKVFQLIGNIHYNNVILLCQDGSLAHNKLVVGLVFPCLAEVDIFTLDSEPVLIMSEYTLPECKQIIQEKIDSLCRQGSDTEDLSTVTIDKVETDAEWQHLDQIESSLEEREKNSSLLKRKRGRPKGSRKKVKTEQQENRESDKKQVSEVDKDDENHDGLPRNGKDLLFPVEFDLQAANEKFSSLLTQVQEGSERLADENEKERWKCCLCGEVVTHLAIHVGQKHAHPHFPCSQCDVKFGSEYLLAHHQRSHTNNVEECGKDMTNLYQDSKQSNTNVTPIKCTQCDKYYSKNTEFQRHFNSAHLGIKANCPICHKELLPNKITSHIRMVHEKVKNHYCNECGKGFYDKRDMQLHIKRIHLHTKELCGECGKELSAGQLKNHIKKCHSGETFKVICPVCGKKVGYLDEHMRSVHKKEKNHQCPLCPLKVYKKNTLKRHLAWHEKGKLTVNGTPKKPRILKRDKDDLQNIPQPTSFPSLGSGGVDAGINTLQHIGAQNYAGRTSGAGFSNAVGQVLPAPTSANSATTTSALTDAANLRKFANFYRDQHH